MHKNIGVKYKTSDYDLSRLSRGFSYITNNDSELINKFKVGDFVVILDSYIVRLDRSEYIRWKDKFCKIIEINEFDPILIKIKNYDGDEKYIMRRYLKLV